MLNERRSKSEQFFSSASSQWDWLRGELFGQQFQHDTVLAMLDPRLRVGDLGCGTGQFSALVAPYVTSVVAVDASADMLGAARATLAVCANVDVRRGALEALPLDEAQIDLAVLALVLHHLPDPARAIGEAARVLAPGGRVLVRGHAAARPHRVSAAHGARVARILRAADAAVARGRRLHGRALRRAHDRGGGEGAGALPGRRHETRNRDTGARGRARRSTTAMTTRSEEIDMATATQTHAFEAARQAGREPFKVKDLSLAEFGRQEIRRAEDIAPAFEALKGRADALYIVLDPVMITNRIRINTLALAARLPTMHTVREPVEAGGLMSYGPNWPNQFRRAADFVDKILRGAKPGDIPVEQPTKFDLVINLTTAKVLGLTVPPTLLATADEVME